jgi:hypothetical protein
VAAVAQDTSATEETLPDTDTGVFVAMDKEQPELTTQASAQVEENTIEQTTPSEPELAAVESGWVVTRSVPMLPFTLADWDPGVIASVADNGPRWLARNSRIVSINGEDVISSQQIRDQLEDLAAASDQNSFDVALGIQTEGIGNYEQTLTIAKERHILLLNGLRFVARDSGTGWTTEVLEAPGSSNFQAGDKLLSYISTWEDLDRPESLQSILERELAAGESSFGFSVSRDDEVWVETFVLSTL